MEDDGKIVIESAQQTDYDLNSLVAAITYENRHHEVDFGHPVGKEAW